MPAKRAAAKVAPNAAVAARYWDALGRRDADAMAACYGPDARFRDEVFTLSGPECGAMWQMLFSGSKDLAITTHPLEVDGDRATGVWEARYTFTATGRPVHNVITTTLTLRAGKIHAQRDRFPFYRWSRMALGVKGTLLGWTPLVKGAVRKQARSRLQNWVATR